ncbi:MAG: LptF/LptG family permease [Armatimonadota bacterium]
MKILDRYIMASIAGTFLFSIALFMGLLLAMDLMQKLVEYIAELGVPVVIALKIIGYRIPGLLVYAFPMSVLLSILLVFNRMSSESEMVAIRAAGVSFVRIVLPALLFAVMVTGLTYFISDYFVPASGQRSAELYRIAIQKSKSAQPISFVHERDDHVVLYTIFATNLDVKNNKMYGVVLELYRDGKPAYRVYAESAKWLPKEGRWDFIPPYNAMPVDPQHRDGMVITSGGKSSQFAITDLALQLKESPIELDSSKKRAEQFTANDLRHRVKRLQEIGGNNMELYQMRMWLVQRFSTPFTCLVFALIAAPLGLRHHRTSNAMGLGISLLVIFAYYFFSVYLNMFGENNRMDPLLAAWLPNVVGAVLGIVLIYRANK